jgi:DNA excision repair protein ERCC-2
MTDKEKNQIIKKFKNTTNTKFGFLVMGGAFSEGIDLLGDALTGVIIVGVGLPMVCEENDILKDHFEQEYGKGFEYAYQYPGLTKVIQAVGRVIRDTSDKGIAILMDERFSYSSYLSLFPPHWKNKKIITNTYLLKKELLSFYNKEK